VSVLFWKLEINTENDKPLQRQGGKMKIVIGPVFDEFGGVSRHIFGIKKFSSHKIVEVPSKFIRTVLNKNERATWLYRKFINRVGLSRYDIIHSHVDPWFVNLCQLSSTKNCKWIHTYHTLYFKEDYSNGLNIWQEKINKGLIEIASQADIKISISNWLHDHLCKNYSIQTEVIPNGVDLDECEKVNPERFIKKYNFSDFVLYIGNLQSVKNPKLFVKLAKQMPKIKFAMIGRNLDEIHLDREYKVLIPENLILLNEIKHEDAMDAISACKAFVMTSKREGIPTVLLEAMAMSKPVVVPNHSGCKEVVCSNDYGFLYEPYDLNDLIDKTKNAIDSKNIGEKARERILKEYNWKIIIKKIDSIYESCAGKSKGME
jgi:glycosyltransferase involved in cell wall biosynthesis